MKYTIKRTFNIALTGLLASLVMFIFLYIGIDITEMAPFNVPPSYAFLYNLGVEETGYAMLLHFCYGTFWAFVLVYTFDDDLSILKAEILAVVLWLFMMFVYSPLIGWGFFGYGYAHHLSADHALYLEDKMVVYIGMTLLVHLIYGWVLGYLSSRWLGKEYVK